jgi:hypothetical protein
MIIYYLIIVMIIPRINNDDPMGCCNNCDDPLAWDCPLETAESVSGDYSVAFRAAGRSSFGSGSSDEELEGA